MKRIVAALIGFAALCGGVFAQGTAQGRAALYTEISTTLAPNQPNGISAYQLQAVFNDTVASAYNAITDAPSGTVLFYTGTPSLNQVPVWNGTGWAPGAGGGGINASVSLTYTGTPIVPFAIQIFPQTIYFSGTGTGSPTTFTQSTESSFRASWDYDETATNTGYNALTTLTFNDLVSGGTIEIGQCSSLTSLTFTALHDVCDFHIANDSALTTLSISALVTTVFTPNDSLGSGDLEVTGCNALTTLSFPSLTTVSGGASNGGLAIISDNNLATLSLPVLATVTTLFQVQQIPLVTLSCPDLTLVAGSFQPATLNSLTSWSFPVLANVAGNFDPSVLPVLTSLSCPDLTIVGGIFEPNAMADLTSLSFATLATVDGNFVPSTMAALTTWSFPDLVTVGGTFAPTTMGSLTTLSCPALQNVTGAFSITSMASLTTATFADMVTYGGTITINSGLGNLTSVTLGTNGTLKAITGATINISGQKLTSASVNAILNLLVTLDGTNGTTAWGTGKTLTINGGTNGAPTGQGITDKATLVARGATVTTN